jgi:hypothetical protein
VSKIDPNEIKSLFKKIKDSDQTIAYAFGLGAKPEECGFTVHKNKKPAALMAEMKGDKSFKKIGFGTLSVKGSEVHLSQIKKVAAIERHLLKLMKMNGLRFTPVADGEAEAEAEADTATAGAEDPKVAQEAATLGAEIDALEKKIDDLLARVG